MKLFSRRKETDAGPRVVLKVEGMHCPSCGLLVDDELEEVPGVSSARTDVQAGLSTIRLTDDGTDRAALIAAVERAGYQATIVG